jgi:hypothetical protein
VTRIRELETTLAATSNWHIYVPPKRRFLKVTRRKIPEDGILRSRRRENIKSYTLHTVHEMKAVIEQNIAEMLLSLTGHGKTFIEHV